MDPILRQLVTEGWNATMKDKKKKMGLALTALALAGAMTFVGCSVPGGGGPFKGGGADGNSKGPAIVNLRSAAGINAGKFAILAKTTVTTTCGPGRAPA